MALEHQQKNKKTTSNPQCGQVKQRT